MATLDPQGILRLLESYADKDPAEFFKCMQSLKASTSTSTYKVAKRNQQASNEYQVKNPSLRPN